MKKKFFLWGLVLIVVITMVIIPYGRVEILTFLHGKEFADGYKQTRMIDDIEYLKVFEYSVEYARVIYIAENHAHTEVVEFIRNDESGWTMTSWDCLWSKTGNADNFFWPYYR